MVPIFPPKIDLFPEMAGETECQTSETVNSLKRKIAGPSLEIYCCIDFNVLIIPDQFNCWCLFSFKIQSAIDWLGKCVIFRSISPNVRSKLGVLLL